MGLFDYLKTWQEERTARVEARQKTNAKQTELRQDGKTERTGKRQSAKTERTGKRQDGATTRTQSRVEGDATIADTIQSVAPVAAELAGDVLDSDLLASLFGEVAGSAAPAPSTTVAATSSSAMPDWLLPVGIGVGVLGLGLLVTPSKARK